MKKVAEKVVLLILIVAISFAIVDVLATNHSTRKVNEKMTEVYHRQLELLDEQGAINRQQEEVINRIQDLYLDYKTKREGR